MDHEFIWPFHAVVLAHILTGSVGLVGFWIPVVSRKGSLLHRRSGQVFVISMLLTGCIAIGISCLTLADPVTTHPHIEATDALIAGIFGWMMLFLAILTINLTWYGYQCIKNRGRHAANRGWVNLMLQAAVVLAAANCMVRGILLGEFLMIAISFVGYATAATNLRHIYNANPARNDWIKEHLKGLVGAGISVYTAFFAFGAVRLMPALALNPLLWSVPLAVGLAIIIVHWRRLGWRAGPAFMAMIRGGRVGPV